jgi:hypothetical protein
MLPRHGSADFQDCIPRMETHGHRGTPQFSLRWAAAVAVGASTPGTRHVGLQPNRPLARISSTHRGPGFTASPFFRIRSAMARRGCWRIARTMPSLETHSENSKHGGDQKLFRDQEFYGWKNGTFHCIIFPDVIECPLEKHPDDENQ